ncbi:FprA family A-type flavoprotein [Ideonella sp. 4Y11]|uniref:FprA family A-type flavoprotein n=1 Tax=Ideonella aquatica TaxID=2824119 RepID=A0A941BS44_9BURK|nr:MBL fold metallo-hydrolase [Ideonella aquatica]MBQ0961200.1 FprA family A-type flavoprotein [Ideonella aquatica]
MPVTLYQHGSHKCLMFTDLADDHAAEAVQSNQFLVVNDDTGAIIDPGGNLAYSELYLTMTQHFPPHKLSAIVASHADPDIIGSLDRWTTSTQAKIYVSTIWERFVPHFCKPGKTAGRVVGIPDSGMRIPIGTSELIALPAHFLHAEGNFQFYDPISKILFSGDLGVSLGGGQDAKQPATSLATLLPRMEAFHRRYMVSNKVLRLWADMVEPMAIDMIVPQHGAPLAGPAVKEFIAWVRTLACGIDLVGPQTYRVPA